MRSVMIVDDEPLMLKYLSTNLEQIAPGWCVTGIAENGLEAVGLLQTQCFDLVITDIKMPEMDGLELANFIYEIYPKTKVVILSGFDDFDYAQRAIRCGVSDYLLKPLNDGAIAETLKKIDISRKQIELKKFTDNILRKTDLLPDSELKTAYLGAIIEGNDENARTMYNDACGRLIWKNEPCGCILVLSVDYADILSKENDPDIISYKIRLNQTCTQLAASQGITISYCRYDDTAILICADNKDHLELKIHAVMSRIDSYYFDTYRIHVYGSYGIIVDNFLFLQKSYASAVQTIIIALLDCSLNSPSDSIRNRFFLEQFQLSLEAIFLDFVSYNDEKLQNDIHTFLHKLPLQKDQKSLFVRSGIFLLYYLNEKLKKEEDCLKTALERTLSLKDLPPSDPDLEEKYHNIVFQAIQSLRLSHHIQRETESSQLVDHAKEYIYAHYSEPISLTLIAEKLGVSSSYLSDLFHKEIGEPYSKFVTRIRMEQAVKLMKVNPNDKIYTLAMQVGFVNAKHFNSVFKKYYKMTPTEYLNKK